MLKQVAILLVCLVAFSAAQTCSTSTLDYIESGTLTLGVPTNAFAQKDYNVTLAGKLGLSAKIHTAFGNSFYLFSHRRFPRIMYSNLFCSFCRYSILRKF